jgi:transposase
MAAPDRDPLTRCHPDCRTRAARDQGGRVRARLLDLLPGRSGKVYADWLEQRGAAFRTQVKGATSDPFHGYKNAIDDQLQDAVSVANSGTAAVDECRGRVQQEPLGHRGREGDPLYGIRTMPRTGPRSSRTASEHGSGPRSPPTERHSSRPGSPGRAYSSGRAAYRHRDPAEGKKTAAKALATFPTCPIPEVARLGWTLKQSARLHNPLLWPKVRWARPAG